MGADDDADHDWLPATKALIREAADRGTPTLGICLGHQLAASLGGVVTRNPQGQQLGLLPMGWTEAATGDDLMAGLVDAGVGIHWNDDIVTDAPAGTAVLATAPEESSRCPVRVARLGRAAAPRGRRADPAGLGRGGPDRYAAGVLDDVLARIAAARQLEEGWRRSRRPSRTG